MSMRCSQSRAAAPAAGNKAACRSAMLRVRTQAHRGEPQYISSTQNPAVKHCVKLRQSGSYRRETGTALLVGQDLVQEVAAQGAVVQALVGLDGTDLPSTSGQAAGTPCLQPAARRQYCPAAKSHCISSLPRPVQIFLPITHPMHVAAGTVCSRNRLISSSTRPAPPPPSCFAPLLSLTPPACCRY